MMDTSQMKLVMVVSHRSFMRSVKIVAVGLAIGIPVAVTAFEVIGGPATITGSSMRVKIMVNFLHQWSFILCSSPASTQQGAECAMLCG